MLTWKYTGVIYMRKLSLVIIVLLMTSSLVIGQTGSYPATPTEVVTISTELSKSGDWKGVMKYMHPEALQSFKDMIFPMMKSLAEKDTTVAGSPEAAMFGLQFDENNKLIEPSPADFMSNMMTSLVQAVPEVADALTKGQFEVVGELPEGDSLMHVVSRVTVTMGGITVKNMQVTSLKKDEGKWKMMLTGEMEGMGLQMQQLFQQMNN